MAIVERSRFIATKYMKALLTAVQRGSRGAMTRLFVIASFVAVPAFASSADLLQYNREFGVAVGPAAQHYYAVGDYIVFNGGLAIDWGLDGPTAQDGGGRMPPVPRLLDAYYDPARNETVVAGVLPPSGDANG